MPARKLLTLCTFLFAILVGITSHADEPGFWGRLNPFRLFISRSPAKTEIHEQSDSERLQALRERLEERNLSQEQVDARIADILSNKEKTREGKEQPEFSGSGRPTLQQLRSHLVSRGVDPAQIDARIDRTTLSTTPRKGGMERNRSADRKSGVSADRFVPGVNENRIARPKTADDVRPAGPVVTTGLDAAAATVPADTPASTVVDPSFREQRSERRGGFARGRLRQK